MKFNFNIPEPAQKEISQLIKIMYPMMHCLDFFFFEMTHLDQETRNITLKILSAVSEAEKLKHFMELVSKLVAIVEKQNSHFSLARFLEFPKMYPETFVKFSNLAKFVFIFIALIQSDTSHLIKLIAMFPDLLLHRYNGLTVFDHVIRLKRRSFIPFMLSIVPEHATVPRPDGNVSLYESLIIADDVEMIKAFELAGFISETKCIRNMNAIQLAFELKSPKLFDYLTDKFGQDKVMSYLVEIYGPAPLKTVKPLPIPDSERKTRRGGKRARKLKELYAQSEARKQKNRLAFGETAETEIFVGDRMEGLGMLGTSGNLRMLTSGSASDQRLREHLKKQAQGKLATTGNSGMKSAEGITVNAVTNFSSTNSNSTGTGSSSNNSKYFNLNSGFKRNKD